MTAVYSAQSPYKTFREEAWHPQADLGQLSGKTFRDSRGNTFKIIPRKDKRDVEIQLVQRNENPAIKRKRMFIHKIHVVICKFVDRLLKTNKEAELMNKLTEKAENDLRARLKQEIDKTGWFITDPKTGQTNITRLHKEAERAETAQKPANRQAEDETDSPQAGVTTSHRVKALMEFALRLDESDPQKAKQKREEARSIEAEEKQKRATKESKTTQKLKQNAELFEDAKRSDKDYPAAARRFRTLAEWNIEKIAAGMSHEELIAQAQAFKEDCPEMSSNLAFQARLKTQPDLKQQPPETEQQCARRAMAMRHEEIMRHARELTRMHEMHERHDVQGNPEKLIAQAEIYKKESNILSKLLWRQAELLKGINLNDDSLQLNAQSVTDEKTKAEELADHEDIMRQIKEIKGQSRLSDEFTKLAESMKHKDSLTHPELKTLAANEFLGEANAHITNSFKRFEELTRQAEALKEAKEAAAGQMTKAYARESLRLRDLMRQAEAFDSPAVNFTRPMTCPVAGDTITPENAVVVTLYLGAENFSSSAKARKTFGDSQVRLVVSKNGLSKLISERDGGIEIKGRGKSENEHYTVTIAAGNVKSVDMFDIDALFDYINNRPVPGDHLFQKKVFAQNPEGRFVLAG